MTSRRGAETLIREGRVSVNGRIVRVLGTRAHPEKDRILVDGRRIGRPRRSKFYLVNKPRGVVTTTRDPHARKTIMDLVSSRERLFPVGRLDAASEGLVLLTNDGKLAQAMLHPSFAVPRTYRVSVDGEVTASVIQRLRRGVKIGPGRIATPLEVSLREAAESRSVLEITLVEGRRHQVRRMMEAVGHRVRRLLRVRFGPLRLSNLAPGKSRALRPAETEALARLVPDRQQDR